jgi:hypothetical protein
VKVTVLRTGKFTPDVVLSMIMDAELPVVLPDESHGDVDLTDWWELQEGDQRVFYVGTPETLEIYKAERGEACQG